MLHKVFHTFPNNYRSWGNKRLTTFESNLITSTFILPAWCRVHLLLIFFIQLLLFVQRFSRQRTHTHTTQMTIQPFGWFRKWLVVCYMVKLNESLSLGVHVALANGPTWLVVQQFEIIPKWIATHQLLEYVCIEFRIEAFGEKAHTIYFTYKFHVSVALACHSKSTIYWDSTYQQVDISEYCNIWKWFDINKQL